MTPSLPPHEDPGIFAAYRADPPRHLRRWLLLALGVAAGMAWIARASRDDRPVVTSRGLRHISAGMSESAIEAQLGAALASRQEGARTCRAYGTPNLQSPSFSLVIVCIEDGKVVDVQERRYSASEVDTPGRVLERSIPNEKH